MKSPISRRQFLKLGSVIPTWAMASEIINFFPLNLFAQDGRPQFFVLIMVDGGMDTTLGLDPRTHQNGEDQKDIFIEYRPEQIIQSGNLRLGPAALALKDHAKDFSIINGVNMRRDAGHESNREYLASGSGDGKKPFLPVESAHYLKNLGPAGILQLNASVRLGNYEFTTTDLQQTFNDSQSSEKNSDEYLENLSDSISAYESAVLSYKEISGPLKIIGTELMSENPNVQLSQISKEKVIAKMFQKKLSFQAVVSIRGNNLDTHSNHAGEDGVPGPHWTNQAKVWANVAEYFTLFKNTKFAEGSLFDYTTFMVVTEFSRTPFLNNSKGKDHNPLTNSVLLAGPQFKAGQVIGGSHVIRRSDKSVASHIGTPIDYTTGKLIQVGDVSYKKNKSINFIYPENIARTVMQSFGGVVAGSSMDKSAPLIPGILKT